MAGRRGRLSGAGRDGGRSISALPVDALYNKVTQVGYVGQHAPHDAFWGARYALIEDPDANPVGIMSPIDPARRTAPPKL